MTKKIVTHFVLIVFSLLAPVLTASAKTENAIQVNFNDPYNVKRDKTIQNMILEALDGASERIDIATYNFTDTKTAEALEKALKREVKVNLVIDQANAEDRIVSQLEKSGVSVKKNNSDGLMHSKYILIDDDLTISGSANLTMSSFFYDNNFMIRVKSAEIVSIFRTEFEEMFIDGIYGSASPYAKPAPKVTLSDGTIIYVRFSPDDHIDDMIESLIDNASQSVYMLAYSFSSDDIAEELINADKDGVDVKVVFEADKAYTDGGGEADNLSKHGVDVVVDGAADGLMHEKAIILDGSVVIAGSYNFTRSADQKNDEQVLVIKNKDIAEQFTKEFYKIYHYGN